MALINCPECGKEISDKALSCPNCGVPINMRTAIPVLFKRPRALTNGLVNVEVQEDFQKLGVLGNGKSFETELMTGRHLLELYAGNTHSTVEINIPDDANKATIEVAAGIMSPKITSVKVY